MDKIEIYHALTEQIDKPPYDAVFPIISGPCPLTEAMKPETTLQNIYRTVTSIISLI